MLGGAGDRLTIYRYVYPFLGLVAEQLNNLFECGLACFGVRCPDKVTDFDIFDCFLPIGGGDQGAGYKADVSSIIGIIRAANLSSDNCTVFIASL